MKKIRAIKVLGDEVYLNPHHFDVLRIKRDEVVFALLPSGDFAKVRVIDTERRKGKIIEVVGAENPQKKICVGISLLKKGKNETQVEFLSILGVDMIVPIITSRVDFSIPHDKIEKVRMRFEKIALESARISGMRSPKIYKIIKLDRIDEISGYERKIVFWEGAGKIISPEDIEAESIFFLVGPEGGFSEEEIKKLEGYGFAPRSCGRRILTSELFPIYFVSAVDFIARFLKNEDFQS